MADTPLQRNGTSTTPMSCEEAQLHKERLQALAEKRKRQTEIEDKRNQLDDLVLQLQHVKSKAMRERWLLQGTGVEEEEARRKQLEQDEEQGRRLEDIIQRLESEIGALESEESQISAKEQVLRERLKETERSIEDLQKSLMTQDGDATSCVLDRGHPSPEQLVRTGPLASGEHASSRPAMFAMEINIQRDPLTGEQRILSANRVSPLEAATRGVKVYDDGKKVVYEVTSSGVVSTSTMENGWSSSQVEQLIQQAARPVVQRGDSMRGHVTVTPARAKVSPHDDDLSPPSCAPPSVPSSPPAQVTLQREPQLGMMPPTSAPITTQPGAHPGQEQSGQPSSDHPVTMVFLGYQEVEDTSDSRRLLGFDGAVKAEVVLIDEDDEKSLREKTVTDISAIDGTAADLVSGRPTTSEAASTELSSEGREPDSASSPNANQDASAPPPGLTPPTGYSPSPGVTVTTANGCGPPNATRHPYTVMKSWLADDVTEPIPRERVLKSVSFQESVSFITDSSAIMELESQPTHDTEMVKEICYLDHVLDAASEIPTNGDTSEHHINTYPDDISSSVSVSAASAVSLQSEGHMYATFTDEEHSAIHTNGHAQDDYTHSKPKFELRAFHEEKKPAKLFSPGDEQPVRVTRRRPTEEVQELERERQELIKDQAVKKNPGIAQRWWNPPQEIPLEEQLEAEQLESLRKYQERKQQKQNPSYTYTQPQVSGPSTVVSFDPDLKRQDDIVEEQIDFSLARKQFLLDNKKDVTPQIYSAKPFSKSRASLGSCDIITESGESHMICSDEGIGGDFTCAQAVMTILHEDDEPKAHFQSSFHPEESDSGLDELSVRSQDTTIFSLDNVSDSGASLPPTPQPLTPVSPPTPQPTTPINGQSGSSLTEDDLEYHAGVLVENAIQNALAAQTGNGWQTSFSDSSAPASPPATKQPLSSSPLPVSSSNSVQSSVCSSPDVKVQEKPLEKLQTPSPPPSQPVSPPPARPKDGGPRIKIQSSYARALAASAPAVGHATSLEPQVSRPTPVYRPPSPPSPDKPEFSYFSKYSEAAELRSTAAPSKGPEVEPASGPFRLRSKKQRTLSMIEEEIRAAQQREEELKKQRENQPTMVVRPSNVNGNGPMRTGVRKTTIPPADKMKSNSQPTRLTLTAKTAPGKIEKVRPAPPVSPSPSEGALSDAGSEDSSGSSRPKNFMQTLMEDYETHKVKRKEKMEDSQYARLLLASEVTHEVLEATRVTRRKSDMALRWEAGIYTNEDGPEEEEEEEEEE